MHDRATQAGHKVQDKAAKTGHQVQDKAAKTGHQVQDRTLQAGYVPRDVASDLDGSEQAVSLWRAGEGLRVLIVPRDAWIGRPRR